MNCKETKKILSAYADGEITDDLKDAVEKHVDGCAECKALLTQQVKLNKQLLSIGDNPDLPDIESSIMSAVMNSGNKRKSRRWLRPVLALTPVALVLAILLPLLLPTLALTPEKVLAKASEALSTVQSFREIDNAYSYDPTTKTLSYHDYHIELEFAEDCWDSKFGPVDDTMGYSNEQIVVGEQVYIRGDYPAVANLGDMQAIIPSAENTRKNLDMLVKIEVLPQESIDGVACFHYLGTVDIDKFIKQLEDNSDYQFQEKKLCETFYGKVSEEGLKKINDRLANYWRTEKKITFEYWIGKNDYMVRQFKVVFAYVTGEIVDSSGMEIVKYYDFNVPITIEAPIDESGALLPGWSVTTGDNSSGSMSN
jgi:hypothetical protein